jgi:hypothetical protein
LEFDTEGGFEARPFQPMILMDMAIITSRVRPLSAVGAAFLALLLDELRPFQANPAKDEPRP